MLNSPHRDTGDAPAERLADDLLIGLTAIAAYLGVNERRAQHMIQTKRIPSWKLGRVNAARKSQLAGAMRAPWRDPAA